MTFYTAKKMRLGIAAWSPNRGSRVRESTFSPLSSSVPRMTSSRGRRLPDPSTSPAHHTETLSIGCPHVVTAADAEPGGWITGFSRVVHFDMVEKGFFSDQSKILPAPFHGFSPVVKFLSFNFISLPSSQIFNLILSFPLLEDLIVTARRVIENSDGLSAAIQPSNPPIFTGSLELFTKTGTELFARQLLSSPGGIHFRKLMLTWFCDGDLSLTMALMEECSSTLESLDIVCYQNCTSTRHLRLHP